MDIKTPKFLKRFLKKYERARLGRLRSYYDSLCMEPDLNDNYIYFAMHLQPERTSTPEAGFFEDHLLAIEILAKSLPAGWKLYVKEHPLQFHKRMRYYKSIHARDKLDYDCMRRQKNVRLVKAEYPSAKLIENAKIISTLQGSTGWEALLAGKPCIIFAPAWYVACRSVEKVMSVKQCKQAIDRLTSLTKEAIYSDILRFLNYMQHKLIITTLGEQEFMATLTIPYAEHVKSLADAIYDFAAVRPAAVAENV